MTVRLDVVAGPDVDADPTLVLGGNEAGVTVTVVLGGNEAGVTVTVASAHLSPADTFTLALPVATALTVPSADTLTRAGFDEDQLIADCGRSPPEASRSSTAI